MKWILTQFAVSQKLKFKQFITKRVFWRYLFFNSKQYCHKLAPRSLSYQNTTHLVESFLAVLLPITYFRTFTKSVLMVNSWRLNIYWIKYVNKESYTFRFWSCKNWTGLFVFLMWNLNIYKGSAISCHVIQKIEINGFWQIALKRVSGELNY